ncbi:predicted protein [Pyrenophora tritici-repentis Pt-1C-BFP]|uniref:Uncharacterized protein n=1 Tax=Pyrenophora tritici-repentis (strain Pt-1C-BFP) TaxID=426418 RepID=B2W519_PYRTR|nr:uncharacterized protein PTRG_04719 [Pyrenophora tritici-repentis Pt-1C-BFP]EDU47626.1 predicted protein [Pyrenophora tritici-repentis Pt-1C-BFP]
MEYQRTDPPFEARQVFECVCTKDPNKCHNGVGKAIAKVKVRGKFDDRMFYFSEMERRKEDLAKKLGTKEYDKALQEYEYFSRLYHNAVKTVDTPHIFTTHEMNALKLFVEFNCQYVPHLLSSWEGPMPEGLDEQAMPGGFLKIILMNKLPGESLDYTTFWDKDKKTRKAIRRAFKVALMEVRKCVLNLHDTTLRNLVWDEKEKKWYVINFQHYRSLRGVPGEERAWTNSQYGLEGLTEEIGIETA